MKYSAFILLTAICMNLILTFTADAQKINPVYDKSLADSLNSDEYGMKTYMLVLLTTGNRQVNDKVVRDSLMRGHLDNIIRLEKEGKLIVAGPFMKNDKGYRGLFILNTDSLEAARAMVESDPAVKAELLGFEIIPWYGSSALPLYLPFAEKVARYQF